MLLNSYEGFDYMDYSRYSMSTKDWGIVFIKSMAATVIIAYLFYDSPIVVIAFPAVFAYCAKLCRQEGVRRQKEKLNEEFMNVLKVLSSNMLAGYSVENAWQEAEKEMELMYGNDSLMLSEIQEMNRQIKMNQTFEAVLSEFAHRSGLEDIVNFSDIFSFAKRSGGRFVDIIESTTYRMWTKYDTNRQIEVAVSAKRLEQKTMNYIPIFLLAFLKLSSRDYMSALYGNPDSCLRYTFAYENAAAGQGRFIHTYKCDGNPLPSFEGEPKLVEIPSDIDEFTDLLWKSLNQDNKVSLFVRFIDIETGKYESRIVNKNK